MEQFEDVNIKMQKIEQVLEQSKRELERTKYENIENQSKVDKLEQSLKSAHAASEQSISDLKRLDQTKSD